MTSRLFKALLFSLLIASLLLTACQSNTPPAATSQATASGLTPTPKKGTPKTIAATFTPTPVPTAKLPDHLDVDPSALRGQEVVFWHPWQGEVATKAYALVKEFNQSNEWGIKVQVYPFYSAGELFDAVNTGLEQPEAPFPAVVAAPADHLAAWSADGDAVIDLQQYLDHPSLGMTDQEIKNFYSAFWNQDRSGERQLGIPALRNAAVIFYNQTWAEELGFPAPPKTPEEFKQQACAAAVKNNGLKVLEKYGTGGWLVDTDPIVTLSWLAAFGADILPEQEGLPYSFETEESTAALAFLRGMLEEGCAWLSRSQTDQDYLAQRMALFYTGTLPELYAQKRINEIAKSQDQWTILPFMSVDGQPLVYTSGTSYAMLNAPDRQDTGDESDRSQMAAWLFVRWMSQPRNQARLVEAMPSLPVSSGSEAQLTDYRANFPWGMLLPLREMARPAPGFASWRTVRRLVEDAAWQVYHLPADQMKFILPQLEETTNELLKREP
jgi:multiple sugar transport system substrate-binding protein